MPEWQLLYLLKCFLSFLGFSLIFSPNFMWFRLCCFLVFNTFQNAGVGTKLMGYCNGLQVAEVTKAFQIIVADSDESFLSSAERNFPP